MAVCVQVDANGYLTPNPALQSADPACTYIVETYTEYMQGWHGLSDLSTGDAAVLSASIGLLWACAWAFRMVARVLLEGSAVGGSDDD
jgi:hypothetical protein